MPLAGAGGKGGGSYCRRQLCCVWLVVARRAGSGGDGPRRQAVLDRWLASAGLRRVWPAASGPPDDGPPPETATQLADNALRRLELQALLLSGRWRSAFLELHPFKQDVNQDIQRRLVVGRRIAAVRTAGGQQRLQRPYPAVRPGSRRAGSRSVSGARARRKRIRPHQPTPSSRHCSLNCGERASAGPRWGAHGGRL